MYLTLPVSLCCAPCTVLEIMGWMLCVCLVRGCSGVIVSSSALTDVGWSFCVLDVFLLLAQSHLHCKATLHCLHLQLIKLPRAWA